MSTVYQLKVIRPSGYIKPIVISLITPLIYAGMIRVLFPPEASQEYGNLFYFIGGGLWFLSLAIAWRTSGEWIDWEIGQEGFRLIDKNRQQAFGDFKWNQLEDFSIRNDFTGTALLVRMRDQGKKKWIITPAGNDRHLVIQFLRDFREHAERLDIAQIIRSRIATNRPFYKTRAARIIGYIFIAYIIFVSTIKIMGLDNGKLEWSNILSTTFFAAIYLFFVFWKKG